MRETKFRGKRVSDGKWIEGVPVPNSLGKRAYILGLIMSDKISYSMNQLHEFCHEVIPESLGQYTGLKDKNDVEICEGDVVLIESEFLGTWTKSEVTWGGPNYPAFDIPKFDGDVMNGFSAIAYTDYGETLKVIGNIHDNPELLEVEK